MTTKSSSGMPTKIAERLQRGQRLARVLAVVEAVRAARRRATGEAEQRRAAAVAAIRRRVRSGSCVAAHGVRAVLGSGVSRPRTAAPASPARGAPTRSSSSTGGPSPSASGSRQLGYSVSVPGWFDRAPVADRVGQRDARAAGSASRPAHGAGRPRRPARRRAPSARASRAARSRSSHASLGRPRRRAAPPRPAGSAGRARRGSGGARPRR